MVKSTTCEKVDFRSKGVGSDYVNQKMNIHNSQPLWKTAVEKPVENVENSELSTGISLLWNLSPSCGKDEYGAAYSRRRFRKVRVTSPDGKSNVLIKEDEKVYKL